MNRLLFPEIIERNAIEAHSKTNHFYDKFIPYEFHLRMAVTNANRHLPVLFNIVDHYRLILFESWKLLEKVNPVYLTVDHIKGGHWFHDAIEDARLTFNNVVKLTSVYEDGVNMDPTIALIAIACTSDPTGLNRSERMNDQVYQRIKMTPGATVTKLNDRIANLQYGILTNSPMVRKYAKENANFLDKLSGTVEFDICKPLVEDIYKLFNKI